MASCVPPQHFFPPRTTLFMPVYPVSCKKPRWQHYCLRCLFPATCLYFLDLPTTLTILSWPYISLIGSNRNSFYKKILRRKKIYEDCTKLKMTQVLRRTHGNINHVAIREINHYTHQLQLDVSNWKIDNRQLGLLRAKGKTENLRKK